MLDAFPRTFRTIQSDAGSRSRLTALVAIALLAGWTAWLFLAKLAVYETSEAARLEVIRATHALDAHLEGRVVKANLKLDDEVREGDVLIELDAESQRHQVAEAKAKAGGIAPKLAATRAKLDAEKEALAHFRNQGKATMDEATNRINEAEFATALAKDELERIERLSKSGAIAEIEALRAKADALRKASAGMALGSQRTKLEREWSTGQHDRSTRIAGLQLDVVHLEAELSLLEAQIESLEHEIELRRIRAPASGRVGEVGNVRVGSFVDEGTRIGTIVARGDLRIVAQFLPASAFGRIRPGQPARIRFDGFPWTEFGETRAQVADVAREVRDARARIELVIVGENQGIPMQHGLPGSVEVEVERTTPAKLILRAAGRLLRRNDP